MIAATCSTVVTLTALQSTMIGVVARRPPSPAAAPFAPAGRDDRQDDVGVGDVGVAGAICRPPPPVHSAADQRVSTRARARSAIATALPMAPGADDNWWTCEAHDVVDPMPWNAGAP